MTDPVVPGAGPVPGPDPGPVPGPVFVHVGLPKTGTTYLQSVLWGHRDAMRERGVLLPGFGPREHLWASGDVREEPHLSRRHADAPGAWGRLAAELVAWPGTGIVSHEFLCGASADQVGRALALLGEREVHVVVTAREIVSLLTARWQEWIKNGATGEIDAYPRRAGYDPTDEWGWGTLDLAEVLERWSTHVPPERVHVLCPPGAGEPPDELWRRFAGVLGVDPGLVDAGEARANESLGVVEVELLRRVNADLAAGGGFRRAVERGTWIRGYLAQRTLAGLGEGERFWPGPRRVAVLRARGEAGLARVAAGGYDVVGSLEVLRTPSDLPERRHPSDVTDAELVPLASRLVATMLADVRTARAETREARAAGAAGVAGERRISRPEAGEPPVSGVRGWRRLWHGGPDPRSTRGARRTGR